MSDKMPREGERLNTIIGQGTVIKGECSVKGTVRVDGIIDGSLNASGVAILGKSGEVKGDMQVGNAIVGGRVDGSVLAEGRLELQTGAKVEGDITAKKLVVEEGVFFQGHCSMEKNEDEVREEKQAAEGDQLGLAIKKEASHTKKIEVEEAKSGDSDGDITFHGERA
ncbi:MAG: polymer-forming cytoskeletal protein [Candidatus Glassbacteria bacterium]